MVPAGGHEELGSGDRGSSTHVLNFHLCLRWSFCLHEAQKSVDDLAGRRLISEARRLIQDDGSDCGGNDDNLQNQFKAN